MVGSVPSISVVGAVAPLRETPVVHHALHRYMSFRGWDSSDRCAFPDPQPNQPFNPTLDRSVVALPLHSLAVKRGLTAR